MTVRTELVCADAGCVYTVANSAVSIVRLQKQLPTACPLCGRDLVPPGGGA